MLRPGLGSRRRGPARVVGFLFFSVSGGSMRGNARIVHDKVIGWLWNGL